MDPITLGVVALMGAAATIAGAAEDLESDIGSQSNPNSQVQLAPQMGHLHRMINKAASGEPVAYGCWCGIAGGIAALAMGMGIIPIVAIAMGSTVAAFVHAIYTVTSHMGRIVGQSQFEQPLFMDVLTQSLGPIAAHGFIALDTHSHYHYSLYFGELLLVQSDHPQGMFITVQKVNTKNSTTVEVLQ